MHSSHLPGTPEDTRNLHPHIDRTSAASVPARTPRGTSPPSPGSLGRRRRTHHALSGRRCLAHTLIPKLPAATDRFGAGGWVEQGNRPDSSESLPRNPPHFLPLSSPGFAATSSPQSTPHTIPPPCPRPPATQVYVCGPGCVEGGSEEASRPPINSSPLSNPRDPKSQANGDTRGSQ